MDIFSVLLQHLRKVPAPTKLVMQAARPMTAARPLIPVSITQQQVVVELLTLAGEQNAAAVVAALRRCNSSFYARRLVAHGLASKWCDLEATSHVVVPAGMQQMRSMLVRAA